MIARRSFSIALLAFVVAGCGAPPKPVDRERLAQKCHRGNDASSCKFVAGIYRGDAQIEAARAADVHACQLHDLVGCVDAIELGVEDARMRACELAPVWCPPVIERMAPSEQRTALAERVCRSEREPCVSMIESMLLRDDPDVAHVASYVCEPANVPSGACAEIAPLEWRDAGLRRDLQQTACEAGVGSHCWSLALRLFADPATATDGRMLAGKACSLGHAIACAPERVMANRSALATRCQRGDATACQELGRVVALDL